MPPTDEERRLVSSTRTRALFASGGHGTHPLRHRCRVFRVYALTPLTVDGPYRSNATQRRSLARSLGRYIRRGSDASPASGNTLCGDISRSKRATAKHPIPGDIFVRRLHFLHSGTAPLLFCAERSSGRNEFVLASEIKCRRIERIVSRYLCGYRDDQLSGYQAISSQVDSTLCQRRLRSNLARAILRSTRHSC